MFTQRKRVRSVIIIHIYLVTCHIVEKENTYERVRVITDIIDLTEQQK